MFLTRKVQERDNNKFWASLYSGTPGGIVAGNTI